MPFLPGHDIAELKFSGHPPIQHPGSDNMPDDSCFALNADGLVPHIDLFEKVWSIHNSDNKSSFILQKPGGVTVA